MNRRKKMKKTVLIIATALFSSAILGGTKVFADEGGKYSSNGQITFEIDTDPTNPVDPTDPEKPVTPVDPTDPEKPVNPGTDGPLSIDYASSFLFGTQKISSNDKTYFAQPQAFKDGSTGPNYVQVTDKRGTLEGWALSVKQEAQFTTEENQTLEGATISFTNASLTSSMADEFKPTAQTKATLQPGQETPLVSAAKNQGIGTWIYRLGENADQAKESVQLFVPGKAVKLAKEYKTTLTWTLKSAPTND